MAERISTEPNFRPDCDFTVPRESRRPIQWNLRTLLLLTSAVAVWVGYFRFQYQIVHLEDQLSTLRRMAGRLIVEDNRHIAAVRLPVTWWEEEHWDVFLPDGQYVMRLATREIDAADEMIPRVETPIVPGRHLIELLESDEEGSPRISVQVDGRIVMETIETLDWDPGHGSAGAGRFDVCEQIPLDEPVVLFRREFNLRRPDGSLSPQKRGNGLMLWIEPASSTAK